MSQGPKITLYSYLSGPGRMRQLVATYNLEFASVDRRRTLIHHLLELGYLLAGCPWGVDVQSLQKLRAAIDWLYNDERR
jgi:hypothetical protein